MQGSRTHKRATTETSSGAAASTTFFAHFRRSTPSAHRWQRHRYGRGSAQHRAGSLSFHRRGLMPFGCFYRCFPSVFLGFHVPGSSLHPASFVSTCFGLQRRLEVAVEGFWFVKFARKGASCRSPTGCYHPPRRESQVLTGGGGPGERVPLGHSSGCPPFLLSERLFVSALPEGEEVGLAGAGFSASVSSGSSSSCAALFSAAGRVGHTALPLLNFDWQPGDFTFLKSSIGRRSQLPPRPPGRP